MKSKESSREVEIEVAPRRLPHLRRRAHGSAPPLAPRIPRVTRLMALAIKFDEMIRRGEVRNYAELARLGFVSRARITQIMNLLNLAPEIQEQLLNLDPVAPASQDVRERHLRKLVSLADWREQQEFWRRLRARAGSTGLVTIAAADGHNAKAPGAEVTPLPGAST